MKLSIIIGTRPEIIRLSSTINLARKFFDVTLIHTGQNYDHNLNEIFFKDLNIAPPDIYLNCSKDNLGKTIGDIISKTYDIFINIKPDAILILGDTNSCLCSYNAKRLKIPIFHLEAGNRCFDPNVPEEINRRLIDHLSDVNMCYMEQAKTNLLDENLKSQYIFVVGSPMTEILLNINDKIETSTILTDNNLKQNEYFVWSSHREENIDLKENFLKVINSINMLAAKYNKKIVFTVHPRTRNKINQTKIILDNNIILLEPIGLIDYYNLQKNSLCVISDSGTVTEESKIIGFNAVLLRTSTEHPEGIDAGCIVIGNNDWKYLDDAINIAINTSNTNNKIINYEDTNFSEKVCKIINGYYHIINKFIWMKN